MELALCRHEFLYSLVVLASWVSDPSGLPLLDDVAGHGPFYILDICSLVVEAFAFSLPGIPTWAGTQTSVTFLPLSCISEIMLSVLLISRSM